MWIQIKNVRNLKIANIWKEAIEAEGLPVRIQPIGDILDAQSTSSYEVCVPKGREHVAEEIIRKL